MDHNIHLSGRSDDVYTIDLGVCSHANEQERIINILLVNDLDNEIVVNSFISHEDHHKTSKFPAILTIDSYELYNNSHIIEKESLGIDSEPLVGVRLPAMSSCRCRVKFQPSISNEDIENPRTSYFSISKDVALCYSIVYDGSDVGIHQLNISIHASMCVSILHVDNQDLDFGECFQGELTHKYIQIWNRSERPLRYNIDVLHADGVAPITMYAGDGTKIIFPNSNIQSLATFASQRIKVVASTKVVQFILHRSLIE